MAFWRTTIFIIGVLLFGYLVKQVYYGQLAELQGNIIDKVGSQHLVNDEKNNTSLLTLCVGQKWLSGPEKGFNGLTVTSDDPQIAVGSFLASEPLTVNMSIEGKAVGVTRVTFELEVAGIGKALSYFQVTVSGECGESKPSSAKATEGRQSDQSKPLPSAGKSDIGQEPVQSLPVQEKFLAENKKTPAKAENNGEKKATGSITDQNKMPSKKETAAPATVSKKDEKTWQFPNFSDRQYYRTGEEAECKLADGEYSNDMVTGSLQPLSANIYYIKLAPESWWSNTWHGTFLINKIVSSNKKVASASYSRKHGLVIKPQSIGTATITIQAAVILDKKSKIDKWPEIKILVEVPQTKVVPVRLCKEEIKEALAIEEKLQCEELPRPSKKPGFRVAAPKTMSKEAEALANQIVAAFKKVKTLPSACQADMITRQARKVAEAFYKTPKPPIGRSCVDCANDVIEVVMEALSDEEVACIQVTKVGRKMFDVALHTAAVIGPPCAVLSENSLVIDTWYFFFAQKVPGVQNHRVYEFYDWINEYGIWWDYIDWGADKIQSNLAGEEAR